MINDMILSELENAASTAEINVARAEAQLYAAEGDLRNDIALQTSFSKSYSTISDAVARAVIARDAAAMVQQQAVEANRYYTNIAAGIEDHYSANVIAGTGPMLLESLKFRG